MSILLVVAGCDSDSPALPTEVSLDRGHVTGASAIALDATRGFTITSEVVLGAPDQITQPQAIALATIDAHRYEPSLRAHLEWAHGAPIDFAHLKQCGRVFYAASPYEPLTPAIPHWVHVHAGPQWIVSFCDRNVLPQVTIAVSAYATNVRVVD